MDVTCERCGTEYEFDETLVSDRGTTVKCTNCGHLFKVYPPGAEPGSSDRAWIVRKKSGGTEKLGSLRELQQRITEGKVDEDDELSSSSESERWIILRRREMSLVQGDPALQACP